MNKAFIFDLDGVLINNEPQWEIVKQKMFTELFGQEIYKELGSTVGLNMEAIHKKAAVLGATVTLQNILDAFYKYALPIYKNTPITEGVDKLGAYLLTENYVIGIVSASPREWMDLVITRLPFKDKLGIIISLQERDDLAHKPEPDGYVEAMKELRATPSDTYILEDSNAGIASGKAAGAFTIGLKQNLVEGYIQQGADIYVNTVEEVIQVLKKR